jgi:hypothetical protein
MDEMTQEPCDFVKLVLQRMDSNPEEFEHYGRWNTLCESLERYAGAYTGNRPVPDRQVLWAYDQFEIDLMVAKYRTIYRDREHKNMLKSILMGNEPKAEWEGTVSGSQYAANTTVSGAIGSTTVRKALLTPSVLQQDIRTQINSAFDEAYKATLTTFNSNGASS